MIGGRVQRVEAMVLVLDLRAVGHGEADLAKGAHDVFGDLRERMQFAQRAAAARQGEICRLFGQGGLEFEFTPPLGQRCLPTLFWLR